MGRKTGKVYREEWDLNKVGLPEVPFFGAYRSEKAFSPLDVHSHDAYEICYLMEGNQNYQVKGRDYLLRNGDIFITRPDESHSSGKRPQEKGSLYWIHILPVKDKKSFLGLEHNTGITVLKSLGDIRKRCFRGSSEIKALLEKIHSQLTMPREPLTKPYVCGLLVSLLSETVRCSRLQPKPGITDLNEAIQYINENLGDTLRVSVIASKFGSSVSGFKARFKREVGLPPAEYIMRCRIETARLFLKNGEGNITDAAMKFGFSSSQHFAFAFKKFAGKRPSDFIRSLAI